MEKISEMVFSAGPRTAIMEWEHDQTRTDLTRAMNAWLLELRQAAYGAGYLLKTKSISLSGKKGDGSLAVLYELEDDPSFRSPM